MQNKTQLSPSPQLRIIDAVAIIIGIVIGAGIFRTPTIVAANSSSGLSFMAAWLIGGLVTLIGALCYAELSTTYPNTGGDYYFLKRSYGNKVAFLFAWARMSVIQTGSISLLSFIAADYLVEIYSLGPYSSPIYAATIVLVLTFINILGIQFGTTAQKTLTLLEVLGILTIIFTGLFHDSSADIGLQALKEKKDSGSMGLALVFVLLTYGGWNEAAYISAELRSGKRKMAAILVWSILIIISTYLLTNFAYLKILGLNGIMETEAVGASIMQIAYGKAGSITISLLIVVSSLTSANATIFTGARSNYALGRDYKSFQLLGSWNQKTSSPINALLVQGLIALTLVGIGTFTRSGFETIVDYTAPVFWFFFLLTGLSVFILRKKDPYRKRLFKVPAYPLLPAIFCLSSAYLLYSSLAYARLGSFLSVAVLLMGLLLLLRLKPEKEAI